ncbi:MAG: hypothetical protein ABIQ88_19780 [Chitinophagaceae bacterium]
MSYSSKYILPDSGQFPNSHLPVLYYPDVLPLPSLFAAAGIKSLFTRNGWTNNWKGGIYTYSHYHSNTHEAMGIISGSTIIRLGGDTGICLEINKGDLLIIPAGVAHKNEGRQDDIVCIAGYPEGKYFDINTGQPGERPDNDITIEAVPIPSNGPLGLETEIFSVWSRYRRSSCWSDQLSGDGIM